MPNPLQLAGAALPPSDYAPLHINRQATGMWPNTNPLRDASSSEYEEKFYGGKQDSIYGGANCEISPHLTLKRRFGLKVYNSQIFPAVNRFYGWNTFDITNELVRVMADTGMGGGVVYDATGPNTKTAIFTKSAGAKTTYFLGVGDTLFMTNGVDNVQLNNATNEVTKWGVAAPTTAPTVSQDPRPNPYYSWVPGTVYSLTAGFSSNPFVTLLDPNGNIQIIVGAPSLAATQTIVQGPPPIHGTTGTQEPSPWGTTLHALTPDGTLSWTNIGPAAWAANKVYGLGDFVAISVNTTSGMQMVMFVNTTPGNASSGATPPHWLSGLGTLTPDANGILWLNVGIALNWANNIGPNTPFTSLGIILDPNGYTEKIVQAGKTGPSPGPNFAQLTGSQTLDGSAIWQNTGPFAVATTAPVLYGYAAATTDPAGDPIDISNMSPPSLPIVVIEGNQVTVQGLGTKDGDTIIVYSTAPGGSTFMQLATLPNPGAGNPWTYVDTQPGYGQTLELQAQVGGEGTPLPPGATCLAYHLGRIFAAVNNVVWVSSGPDAIVSGSSGNAGFDTTFTAQSQIIRFEVNSLGVLVYTLRDVYLIQGSATSNDPLYMTTFIQNLPLLHYDALTTHLASTYMFGGHQMVQMLDPGSGITESSFPIAPLVAQIDPAKAYLTMHTGGTGETALYLSDGATLWHRMAPTSAPESGSNWSPPALITGGMSALQSTEVLPGTAALLIGPPASTPGPIRMRDTSTYSDAGTPYPMTVDYNPIVLANPGQLAGLAWMTLKCSVTGNAPMLGVTLDEISGDYENVPRTRQDPTNLPPSTSLLSNRHSLLQNQKPAWCQVIKFGLQWGATDTPDELMAYTIFGQMWQEQRSQ